MNKLLQTFYFNHKVYEMHLKVKTKTNQNKPCSAPHRAHILWIRQKKKSNTEREDIREKKGKIFKNKKKDYL